MEEKNKEGFDFKKFESEMNACFAMIAQIEAKDFTDNTVRFVLRRVPGRRHCADLSDFLLFLFLKKGTKKLSKNMLRIFGGLGSIQSFV